VIEKEAELVTIGKINVSGDAVSVHIVFRHKEAFTVVKRGSLLHDCIITVDGGLDKLDVKTNAISFLVRHTCLSFIH